MGYRCMVSLVSGTWLEKEFPSLQNHPVEAFVGIGEVLTSEPPIIQMPP